MYFKAKKLPLPTCFDGLFSCEAGLILDIDMFNFWAARRIGLLTSPVPFPAKLWRFLDFLASFDEVLPFSEMVGWLLSINSSSWLFNWKGTLTWKTKYLAKLILFLKILSDFLFFLLPNALSSEIRKHVRGTTLSLASRLAMTKGQPRPNC